MPCRSRRRWTSGWTWRCSTARPASSPSDLPCSSFVRRDHEFGSNHEKERKNIFKVCSCHRHGRWGFLYPSDAVVAAAKVPCPYRAFGCDRYVVYHGVADHQRGACQCVPCSCPDSGCPFVGSRGMLLDHFADAHSRLAVTVRYGRPWNLSLALSQRWHVLVGEEDRSVFLVSLGALGAATAVSLVCVRAGVAPAPQFWCKLFVELPGDDKDKLVLMASTVGSSALTGGMPAPGQGMFLVVPQELLSGDVLPLSVRIDQLRPATAATHKSTTPRARTPGRMQ